MCIKNHWRVCEKKKEKFRAFQSKDYIEVEKGAIRKFIQLEILHRLLETAYLTCFYVLHCHSLRRN